MLSIVHYFGKKETKAISKTIIVAAKFTFLSKVQHLTEEFFNKNTFITNNLYVSSFVSNIQNTVFSRHTLRFFSKRYHRCNQGKMKASKNVFSMRDW